MNKRLMVMKPLSGHTKANKETKMNRDGDEEGDGDRKQFSIE